MTETVRKGYWKADAATQKKLIEEYLESVNRHGVGCSEFTCGNPRLSKYMIEQAKAMGIPTPLIDGFKREMEKAIGQQISSAAKKVENFVERNEAAPKEISQAPVPVPAPTPLEGYVMEVTEQNRPKPKESSQLPVTGEWDALWVSLPVLGLLCAWQWRRWRA